MLQAEGISQQKLSFVPFAQTAKLTDLNVSAYEMKIRAWKIFDAVNRIGRGPQILVCKMRRFFLVQNI